MMTKQEIYDILKSKEFSADDLAEKILDELYSIEKKVNEDAEKEKAEAEAKARLDAEKVAKEDDIRRAQGDAICCIIDYLEAKDALPKRKSFESGEDYEAFIDEISKLLEEFLEGLVITTQIVNNSFFDALAEKENDKINTNNKNKKLSKTIFDLLF